MASSSTRRSVVRRVFALTALWAGVLGLSMAGVAIWQYWRVSVRAVDSRVADDAAMLARQIVVTDGLVEVEVPGELRLALSEGSAYYGIYDGDGRYLDGDAPPMASSEVVATGVWTVAGHRERRVSMTPGAAGAADAPGTVVVRVGRPLAPVAADVRRLAASLLVASFAAVLLAAPLAVWLRREMARSIRGIDRIARVLAPGQSARIDPASVDDEFVGVASRLNEAFDRLEQAVTRERQLTADASHELRTPVATIVAESEWGLARPRHVDEYRHALEVCARQGRRLKTLIESLLTLARIESGQERPGHDAVGLRSVVEEVVGDLRLPTRDRGVAVRCEGDATARGDRVQLTILVTNLLSNALRYSPDGGIVSVRLDVGVVRDGVRWVTLAVRDSGEGMPAADAARVFDRFWRAAPSRSSREGGTGLGLAISKAIVDAHGGRIRVATAEGTGTVFTVELPG